MGSDKVSNIGAVPIAHDEKIVSFSKSTEAPAEAYPGLRSCARTVAAAGALAPVRPRGQRKLLRSTLWTKVEQPDFKISGRRAGVVQERAAAPRASARPYVAASDVGCTVG